MSGRDDDDRTTSTRAKKLRGGSTSDAPQRPTIPLTGRASKLRNAQLTDDFGERPDDAPTMFDPNVPTGADANEASRSYAEREAVDAFPDLDEIELPTGATVIGKRSVIVEPQTAPTKPKRPPMQSDARIREPREVLRPEPPVLPPIDESARTKRWDPPLPDPEPTGPALRPPPAPPAPVVARPAPVVAAAPIAPPAPIAIPQQYPLPPVLPLVAPNSEPIRVMSMKAPSEPAPERAPRPVPEVRVRPIADARPAQNQTPPQGMGYLAPPRDPNEARSRRRADYIIWGSVAVIVAAVVMLVVWFLAR